jgi:transposase
MAGLRFEQAAHHIVLEDCIATVEAATARPDRLEAHIEAALPDWSLAPAVQALQALRGMALVAAATLVAELGDITRFANPRQLMAYLGLVPSEHSSGGTRHQGAGTALPALSQACPDGKITRRSHHRDRPRIGGLCLGDRQTRASRRRLTHCESTADITKGGSFQQHPKLSKAGGAVTARRTLDATNGRRSSDAGP